MVLLLLVLAGFVLCWLWIRRRKVEGFDEKGETEETPEENALLSLMGTLKRINGYLMDPEMWSHRIGLIGLTPVEMARMELNRKQSK
jgi:hypothetical protein